MIEAEDGIVCSACWAASLGLVRRTSASDIEFSSQFVELEGLVQPITVTFAGRSGGPAQNGESCVSSHTAEAAALLQ